MSLASRPTSPSMIGLPSVVTMVVWLVFTAAGVAGLRLQYQQEQARERGKPPVVAEQIDVKMIGAAASQLPRTDSTPVPKESIADAPPQAPALLPVAQPSADIPFALPVPELPRQARINSSTIAPVQHLIFGTGEGDQPPPEYPREAKIAHQQGTVTVRFTVNEEGQVIDATAFNPSPYALLNQAAVRAVRDTWTFPHGKVGVYEVSFQFELH